MYSSDFHIFSLCLIYQFYLQCFFPLLVGIIFWSMGNSPWVTTLKKKANPSQPPFVTKGPSVREWGLMGPFLSCNEMIKSSVLCRACVENSSGSKFITKMSMLCQEQIMLNFPIIPLMLTLSLLPHRSLEEGV